MLQPTFQESHRPRFTRAVRSHRVRGCELNRSRGENLLPVEVKEVSFAGSNYHELKGDSGSPWYSAPHWVDVNGDGTAMTNTSSGEKNYPVAFTRNTKPQVGGKFKIAGLPSGQSVKIKASSAQGLQIPETTVTPAADGAFTLPLTPASNNLTNSVQFHNAEDDTAFKIDWEISIGSGGWSVLGSTKHTVYIVNSNPTQSPSSYRETLFYLACHNADNKSSENQIVDAIYGEFSDRKVAKVLPSRGKPSAEYLSYTHGGLFTPTNQAWYQLLDSGTAQCTAWSNLLDMVLQCHGITANRIQVRPPPPDELPMELLTNLAYDAAQLHPGVNFHVGQTAIFVKNRQLNPSNGFSGQDLGSIPGQNVDDPASIFGMHEFNLHNGRWFDPSYGTRQGSNSGGWQNDWELNSLETMGGLINFPQASDFQRKWSPVRNACLIDSSNYEQVD